MKLVITMLLASIGFSGVAQAQDCSTRYDSNICSVTGVPVAPGDVVLDITNHHVVQAKLPTKYIHVDQQIIHPAAPAVVYVGQTDLTVTNANYSVPTVGDKVAVANMSRPVVKVVRVTTSQ